MFDFRMNSPIGGDIDVIGESTNLIQQSHEYHEMSGFPTNVDGDIALVFGIH